MQRPAGRFGLRCAILAVLLAGTGVPCLGQTKPATDQAAAKPAQIDRNGVLILIRTTLLALNAANETGNYTVLRDLGSSNFRDANTAARLAEIFASQRAQKLDLSGVAVLDPQLTLLPQIESNGLLHIAGFFPSAPLQINFELLFAAVDGRWKLFGLAVNVGSSAPAAPVPPSPPPPSSSTQVSEPKHSPAKAAAPRPIPTRPAKPETDKAAPSTQAPSP